jgi:hypothetical protein
MTMTKPITMVLGVTIVAAVQLLLGTPQALAIYIRDDVAVARYNNLAAHSQYQAVGYLGSRARRSPSVRARW